MQSIYALPLMLYPIVTPSMIITMNLLINVHKSKERLMFSETVYVLKFSA